MNQQGKPSGSGYSTCFSLRDSLHEIDSQRARRDIKSGDGGVTVSDGPYCISGQAPSEEDHIVHAIRINED